MTSKKNILRNSLVPVLAIIMGACIYSNAQKQPTPNAKQSYLDFPTTLTPTTPHDVDRQLQKTLTSEQKFVEVQRLFEILAWQNFVSLNWPLNGKGQPQKNINIKGSYPWQKWKESYEVFLPNGGQPKPWGQHTLPSGFTLENSSKIPVMFRTNRVDLRGANVEDEIDQAFTKPIWDQNGNLVRYQVMMNESEFDYIVKNELYNLDGQIAFSKKKNSVKFPSANRHKEGAIEIKLAWKVIDKNIDIAERFLTTTAYVMNEDGKYSIKEMGLVGMHIALKTDSSPQWIWATFEHVDNLQANSLASMNGKKLRASFNDPTLQIDPINVYPQLKGDYSGAKVKKNQIQRVAPISKETQALNTQVQNILANNKSVLQYYKLIGTQWPTDPSSKPYDVSTHTDANPPKLPEAVTNKSGGKPTPVWLTNMVMETYFQGATTGGTNPQLYNVKIANEQAWNQIQGFKTYGTNHQRIFGTESCIGCHYSASIAVGEKIVNGKRTAVFGNAAEADFSWLLQMKAQFKK